MDFSSVFDFVFFTFFVVLAGAFWMTPLAMIIWGASNLHQNPPKAKKAIIIAGIWLMAGVGLLWLINFLTYYFELM